MQESFNLKIGKGRDFIVLLADSFGNQLLDEDFISISLKKGGSKSIFPEPSLENKVGRIQRGKGFLRDLAFTAPRTYQSILSIIKV